MSRTHRPSIARNRPLYANRLEDDIDLVPAADSDPDADPADVSFGDVAFVTVLADIVRQHRWKLVATARRNLRGRRGEAEDVVQEVCSDAVDGTIALPVDAPGMLDELLHEVARRCRATRFEEK